MAQSIMQGDEWTACRQHDQRLRHGAVIGAKRAARAPLGTDLHAWKPRRQPDPTPREYPRGLTVPYLIRRAVWPTPTAQIEQRAAVGGPQRDEHTHTEQQQILERESPQHKLVSERLRLDD